MPGMSRKTQGDRHSMVNAIKNSAWAVPFLLVGAVLGCSRDPLQKVNVHGKVTFDGQACPGSGRLTFAPIEVAAGMPNRMGSGKFDTDGEYAASSFRPGDGLVPGRYNVGVACFDSSMLSGAPGDDEFRRASYVREDFKPPELVVESGSGPIEFNIDVPLRDPSGRK
jgi:hypothetical protein